MYDVSGCNKVGKRISNEIISVFEEILQLVSDLAHRKEDV